MQSSKCGAMVRKNLLVMDPLHPTPAPGEMARSSGSHVCTRSDLPVRCKEQRECAMYTVYGVLRYMLTPTCVRVRSTSSTLVE